MIDTDLVSDILRRFNRLKTIRQPYEGIWSEVSDFAHPRRSNWDLNAVHVDRSKLFNSRAVQAAKLQAYGFAGYMVSRTKPWFNLRLTDEALGDETGVGDYLEAVCKVLVAELARSNFYDQNAEFVPDGGSIGTATMFMDEDIAKGRAMFSTRHPKELWIDEGPNGQVDTVYRQFRLTNRTAAAKWGKAMCAASMDKAQNDPYGYSQFLHVIQPREGWNPDSEFSVDMPYGSYYLDLSANEVVDEGGFEHMPYACWRWSKNTDEVYGRSPAMDALTDILRLNQISRTQLELAQKIADPPLNVPETMRDSLRVTPGGRNYTVGDEEVRPIILGANYPVTIEIEQNIEKVVNEHFNSDFFLMLNRIDRDMTAREVLERKGEQAAVLGATIGSYQTELLNPVIEHMFRLAERQGKLPPLPQALVEAGGHIEIEYTGYLAQLQRKYYSTSGITSSLEIMMPLMQAFPDSIDNVDTDQLLREAADAFGLPKRIMRETPDRDALRARKAAAVQEQMQAQAASEQQAALMANADKLNQPVNPNSPLAQIQGAMGGPAPAPGGP